MSETLLRAPAEFRKDTVETSFSAVQTRDFKPLTDRDINQGITEQAYWLRVTLSNTGDAPVTWVLNHETSYIDHMQVYFRDAHSERFQSLALSDRVPFHDRPLNYRKLAFQHTTDANSHTELYVKLYFDNADSVSLNFHLREASVFIQQAQAEHLFYGGYYGVMLSLMTIAMVIALLLRNTTALMYAALLLATTTKWLLLNGYGFQYVWPNSVFFQNEGFHIVFLLFAVCGLQFSKSFLKLDFYFPRVHTLFSALQAVCLLGIVMRFAGWYVPILHLSYTMLAVLALVIPAASWAVWRRGAHHARWYTYAWLIYSCTLWLALGSASFTWFNWGMQPLMILQLGSLLEVGLLMVAMSEGLMGLENDRRQALAMANQDPLTGLGNRRLLQVEFENFKERYQRGKKPVFLIMIDLDHFKAVNDQYGHDAGDVVLKKVAKLLRSHSRDKDVCIRYGGEEFALLLEADNQEEALAVSERIRREFASTPTPYEGQLIEHTLSSGITPVLSQGQSFNVKEMMRRADAALYQGKATGRNRTVIYEEEHVD
ncbi:diguanylate cyclase [Marinimicrobium sp. ABcell2]|uniref:sensor domain-containing diguanylate cyclase n=1 Tax=Marinimicrobium sp. ABcell2 TaxID=3069751 RepID=UPI0027B06CD7|nr:diguanylate cyclase [Marinimicrobium sp. ABcell2]MDQ2077059.1 diguanylate cyclase [Marinimicrobium sp. ABcell2]